MMDNDIILDIDIVQMLMISYRDIVIYVISSISLVINCKQLNICYLFEYNISIKVITVSPN